MGYRPDEGEVVYGKEGEKPTTKKTRITFLVVFRLFGIALLIGLWFWIGWWVLILAALGGWASIDSLSRGDHGGVADRAKWGI
ncbi:MAG: hypothetical protein QNL12_16020 [Acidimicrobiia bacterium]|nr:hypothetical protein [Acidimicrobiia bacterium]